jgi:hypothetical protein
MDRPRARRKADLGEIDALLPLADPFERIVILASAAVLVLGLLALWA